MDHDDLLEYLASLVAVHSLCLFGHGLLSSLNMSFLIISGQMWKSYLLNSLLQKLL